MEYIAHISEDSDSKRIQTVLKHLLNTGDLARKNGAKIGAEEITELIGFLHDLGKYSNAFQNYLQSATGVISEDDYDYVDANKLKGKIDHSSAGAQYVWQYITNLNPKDPKLLILGQALALCIASHHSGLINCISPDGEDEFSKRMNKSNEKTFYDEVIQNADKEIIQKINSIISKPEFILKFTEILRKLLANNKNNELLIRFHAGLLIKYLFSCLIDADRTDTADFETPANSRKRQLGDYVSWDILIERFEEHLKLFKSKSDRNKIDEIRNRISEACMLRAQDQQGIYTLTVPTGGGKTLASLRFALHHARKHKLDRIIYVIPYTTIIEQNANVVREILEIKESEKGKIILEHHSNLLPEVQTSKSKLLTENWDAPIVFTTIVQFLETIYGAGTRGIRRMHQLAKSVIIFDEIQTLPIKTVHLFNNAINFLVDNCNTSIVLCTATQPLLNQVDQNKGRLNFTKQNEIAPNIETLFKELRRVHVIDKSKTDGWSVEEIAELAINQTRQTNSCLVVVNTKKNAKILFENIKNITTNIPVYHLSTSMCPAHRLNVFNEIKRKLSSDEPIICVSTQLIEAGVDIDFGTVIRFMAGIDSIIQAAGRCNRNGKRPISNVFIVNPKEEVIDSLVDIKVGKEITQRILYEMKNSEAGLPEEFIHPKIMERYFQYYFYNRSDLMTYPVDEVCEDTLLNMLSINAKAVGEYERKYNTRPNIYFRQSFQTTAEYFRAIDAPTIGIIVPYENEGIVIIADLFSQFAFEKRYDLLKRAQRYTVNVYPNVLKKLEEQNAIAVVPEIEVYTLSDKRYYHSKFGLDTEIANDYETLLIN